MGFEGYSGQEPRDKWAELLVEIVAIGLALTIFGIQVAGWVTIGLLGWRALNYRNEMI